jgi:pimeloyl-ACP methyl ester carboxylesterase
MFYFRQCQPLAAIGCDVHTVDLLGHGMSSRPRFCGTTREQGEAFYTDALEAWRRAAGIGDYVLVGHSFGGYIATCWALAHPQRCMRLVLVGSAGMQEHNRACLGPNGNPWNLEGLALEGFNALWHTVQPQAIVRMAGPLGPVLASDYIQRKFGPRSAGGLMTDAEAATLERYLFHCLAGGGKGAVANPPPHHALFFGPGVTCFAPLSVRLDALDRPVSFIYGLHDWMCWRDAEAVRAGLSRPASLALVENAGHHVYLENPEGFHDALAHALRAHLPGGAADAAPRHRVTRFGSAERARSGDEDAGAAADASADAAEDDGGNATDDDLAEEARHGGALPPPRLYYGVCRYPSGFENAAADEALELCLAAVEADAAAEAAAAGEEVEVTGVRPLSDRQKNFFLYD